MKKISRFFSKLFTAVLSGAIVSSGIPSYAAFVPSSSDNEDTIPEPKMISAVEGKASEYGLTPVYYVDENGNEIESDLIPEKMDKASELPSAFDLRDYGYITPVKWQNYGTCWSYATLAACESNMIMNGLADNSTDLSESHLIWFTYGAASTDTNDPLCGDGVSNGTDAYDNGGNCYDSRATLGKWSGVQLEENVSPVFDRPAVDESLRYTSYGYLVNSDELDKDDLGSIKEHLMNTGALYCSYCCDDQYHNNETSSHYCYDEAGHNHAVAIVGWDDNYSKENFVNDSGQVPSDDGAWIVKNSWGSMMSGYTDGYFYMSYEDKSVS